MIKIQWPRTIEWANGHKFRTKFWMNCGTYDIKTGRIMKTVLKFILGKKANVRLMGRGDRQSAAELAKIAEPNRYPGYSANRIFRCTLPLKYAKKVAVYLTYGEDYDIKN